MDNDLKLDIFSSEVPTEELNVSYIDAGIKAGFPSPAQDYLTGTIELNRELIRH